MSTAKSGGDFKPGRWQRTRHALRAKENNVSGAHRIPAIVPSIQNDAHAADCYSSEFVFLNILADREQKPANLFAMPGCPQGMLNDDAVNQLHIPVVVFRPLHQPVVLINAERTVYNFHFFRLPKS